MQLISVNIGQAQAIVGAKESGFTGIYKQSVLEPVRVTRMGLPGDAICDTKHHGGVDQAVYVYGWSDYEWWSAEVGDRLEAGWFGENLTISDLESAQFSAGDKLRIANVVLEVTAPRIPCITLNARMNDPQFIERFKQAERPGLYCRVLQEGMVQAGQSVEVERYDGESVTMVEMFRNFYRSELSEDFLKRYLAAPTPARGRAEKEAQLHKYQK